MTKSQFAKNKYDLEERTARFGQTVIALAKKINENSVTRPLITQLVRAATSIGTNYCEADNAESRKDFIHKISICRKESKETKHWLTMLSAATPIATQDIILLSREALELTLIFNAIVNSTRREPH